MRIGRTILAGFLALLLSTAVAQSEEADIEPPAATIKPHELEKHGDVRIDNYFWLNDRENPEVIEYLEAENAYTEKALSHLKGLEDALFEEIKGRIKQTDESVPYKLDNFYYYYRYEEGKSYRIYCRKEGSLDATEQGALETSAAAVAKDIAELELPVA